MDEVALRLSSFERALATLEQALALPPGDVIVRDASIQRFEYTFEAAWKALKVHLRVVEGVDCASPKACVRQALKAAPLSPEETERLLRMADDRNLTSHAYIEPVAVELFARLGGHAELLRALSQRLRARLES